MSKRIDDLKFGAILEAISQISPRHGRALSVTMDLIDQREAEREAKELNEPFASINQSLQSQRENLQQQQQESSTENMLGGFIIFLVVYGLMWLFNILP